MPNGDEVNYTLIRLTLETIPNFDGDKDLLEIFISAADRFYNRYASINEDLRGFVHQALLGKLKGNALLIIGSRAELNSWHLVREELRNVYGERLSLDNLEQMLMTCTIQKNEHYQNFGKRLQLIRSKLAQKIATTPTNIMDAASKLVHNRQYSAMACKIFVRNLDRRLRDKIIVQSPNSLEAAMALVQEDENFELFLNPNQNQFKQLIPRSTIRQTSPINPSPRPQRPQTHNLQPQFPIPYRQQFPSQPINIQPRQITQHFPTNRQTFGPPQNVWKPQNKSNNNPVPMSVTSRIPSNLPNNNNSVPTSRISKVASNLPNQNYQNYEPMSTTSKFTVRPPFHGNMEINTYQEADTAIDDNNFYQYEENDVPNEEYDYALYDTDPDQLQHNDPQQDFPTTTSVRDPT